MPKWRVFGVRLRTHPWDRGVNIQRIPVWCTVYSQRVIVTNAGQVHLRAARRDELLKIADRGGFERIVVFNGAVGFFAGAYQVLWSIPNLCLC
jgi:hypothetical protein